MISVQNISKSWGDRQVLKDFSYSFTGTTCIMGGSGIGKTTLAKIMAGLTPPDAGTVHHQGRLSFVFQEDRLLSGESMLTNLLFVRNNIPKAKALLSDLGLEEHTKKAHSLSGGMKRRVALARALMPDFDILIMDEPFKGLDEALKHQAINLINQYHQDKTIIVITHDPQDTALLHAKLLTL